MPIILKMTSTAKSRKAKKNARLKLNFDRLSKRNKTNQIHIMIDGVLKSAYTSITSKAKEAAMGTLL